MSLVSTGICLSRSSLPTVTTPQRLLLALTQEGVTSYVSCLLFVLFSFLNKLTDRLRCHSGQHPILVMTVILNIPNR